MSNIDDFDEHDHDSSEGEGDQKKAYESLLNNPSYFSSIMKVKKMRFIFSRKHVPSSFKFQRALLKNMVKALPAVAQKRVKALKNLQLDFLKEECTFFKEVYQLERKYQIKYQTIAEKRKAIITGEYEPKDSEAEFKSDEEDEDDEENAMIQERLKSIKSLPQYDENVKGLCTNIIICDDS